MAALLRTSSGSLDGDHDKIGATQLTEAPPARLASPNTGIGE